MAIKHSNSANGEITREEFKEWMKSFDADGDGRISKAELRKAIRSVGGRFSFWKGGRGVRQADTNRNGFVDDDEIENLIVFARKNLGMNIALF